MYQCSECDYQHDSLPSLARHFGRIHKDRPKKQLYITLFCNGVEPTCACGCGEHPKYLDTGRGFRKYKRGHAARVKNNWGHNSKALEKSIEKRRQMLKDGELEPWNKGLTKDSHPSLVQQGETFSANFTDEDRQIRSIRMRQNRLDGTVPTLKGADHSQWKGGTSLVSTRCHASHRLYKEWKFPTLKAAGFACQRCSSTDLLEVHHDQERMADLIGRHTAILNPDRLDDFDLQTKVVDAVVQEHIESKISGEVVCHECHKKEHPSYNYR